MSESDMVHAVGAALRRRGITDRLLAVGQFTPRGSTGGMFAGGLIGDEMGGLLGAGGDAVGTVGGAFAGRRAAGAAQGLPPDMLVGVSADVVYGFAGRSRSREPDELLFQVPRKALVVTVRQRLNVRVLVLTVHGGDGEDASIELEGNRLPITHSKDVIDVLRAAAG